MSIIDISEGDGEGGKKPHLVKEFAVDDYRFHMLSDSSYLVFKDVDEELSYTIDAETGCDCPASTYRQEACKHEKMSGWANFAVDGAVDVGPQLKSLEDLMDLLD